MDTRYSSEAIRGKQQRQAVRSAPNSQLVQEIKPGMIELMKPKLTFTQSEIQDGDIICFQVDINEKE